MIQLDASQIERRGKAGQWSFERAALAVDEE